MKSNAFRVLTLLIIGMFIAGCGGGSTPGNGSAEKSASNFGSVSIILTDAPTDYFSEVNFTFTKIEFLGGEGGPVTLFEGEETVNLLSLEDFGMLLAVADDVPAGSYSKIRLTLSQPNGIELVPLPVELPDGSTEQPESIYPKLAGNGKMDLNPRMQFDVRGGEMLTLQLDIDAKKSIHVVETGKGKPKYIVRPVVFIDIVGSQITGKLVRTTGYVHSDPTAEDGFELCTFAQGDVTLPDSVTDEICIDVATDNASVFGPSGDPALLTEIEQGNLLTVVGLVDAAVAMNEGIPQLRLSAEVIEIGEPGTYFILDATVDTGPVTEDDTFIISTLFGSNVPAQLQPGAKVFERNGTRLDYTAIVDGINIGIDGVPAATEPGVMKTTLVVVNQQPPELIGTLSGMIQSLSLTEDSLMVSDVVVMVDASTVVIKAGTVGDTIMSDVIGLDELAVDDDVVIYGVYSTGGEFIADVILVKI